MQNAAIQGVTNQFKISSLDKKNTENRGGLDKLFKAVIGIQGRQFMGVITDRLLQLMRENFAGRNVETVVAATEAGYILKFIFIKAVKGNKNQLDAVSGMCADVLTEMRKRGFSVENCHAGYSEEQQGYFVGIDFPSSDLEKAKEIGRGFGRVNFGFLQR